MRKFCLIFLAFVAGCGGGGGSSDGPITPIQTDGTVYDRAATIPQPTKLLQAVMIADQAWETTYGRVQVFGSVLPPGQGSDRWQMFYTYQDNNIPGFSHAYATGNDGISWANKQMNVPGQISFSVLYDEGTYRGAGDTRFGTATDPTGWAFTEWPAVSGPYGGNDTATSLVRHGTYIAFVRDQGLWYPGAGPDNPNNVNQVLRRIGVTVSTDFKTWTPKQPIPELDSPDGGWTQPYALSATAYKGRIVGLLWWLHLDRVPGNNKHGTVDAELVWAERPEGPWTRTRTPFLASGAPGEPDHGMAAPAPFVVHEGTVYVYYTRMAARHGTRPAPGETTIGLATMPQAQFDAILGL